MEASTMKKRILSNALAVMLLIAILPAVIAANFNDVTDGNMRKAVEMLNNLGVISATDKFNPSGELSRAQFCVMAVRLSGIDVEPHKSYTIFPDVRSNHWAHGYVNAAVSSDFGHFAPLPDGTFAPDRAITYYEAITILVKMLGYDDDNMRHNWPRSYLTRATTIGLTKGVPVTEILSRGQGALLFYNLLYTPVYITGDPNVTGNTIGEIYLKSKLRVETEPNQIITHVNVYDRDGKLGIRVFGGEEILPIYSEMDRSLIGCRVDLLLDRNKNVLGAEQRNQTFDTITISAARRGYIVDSHNREIDISPTVEVIRIDDIRREYGSAKYNNAYSEMRRGEIYKIAYTPTGAIDYLFRVQDDVTRISDVVILDIDAMEREVSGIATIGYFDDEWQFYPTRTTVDSNLIGRRVDLTLNHRFEVIRIEPIEQSITTLTVAVAALAGVTANNGTNLLIPEATRVYANGMPSTYANVFPLISVGDTLQVFYNKNSTIDYIVWNNSGFSIGSIVYLPIFYHGDNNSITLSIGSNKLTLTPEASLMAARFKLGDPVTLAVSSTGEVHAVYAGHSSPPWGRMRTVDKVNSEGASTVILRNGLILYVTVDEGYNWSEVGEDVFVYAKGNGIVVRGTSDTGGSGGGGGILRTAVVNNVMAPGQGVILTEQASTSSRVLGFYYNGTVVQIIEYGLTWSFVQVDGIRGFMATQHLRIL